MSRRSRLVGRPAPRARTATRTASSLGGGGGLWSITACAASGAETRFTSTFSTTRIRSTRPPRTTTRSPTRTFVAGLARSPLTRTCPALTAAVACERLLKTRTAHSQLSTRALVVSVVATLRAYETSVPYRPGADARRQPSGCGPRATVSRWCQAIRDESPFGRTCLTGTETRHGHHRLDRHRPHHGCHRSRDRAGQAEGRLDRHPAAGDRGGAARRVHRLGGVQHRRQRGVLRPRHVGIRARRLDHRRVHLVVVPEPQAHLTASAAPAARSHGRPGPLRGPGRPCVRPRRIAVDTRAGGPPRWSA